MRELTARLSALAPEAANALQVIAYFDKLVEHGAGVRSVIRGAAVLSACPAGLLDRPRGTQLRILPDGTSANLLPHAGSSWPRARSEDGSVEVWLESDDSSPDSLNALILERALLATATSLGQALDTSGHSQTALVRLLVAADSGSAAQEAALRGLGLTPATLICLVATLDDTPVLARSVSEARRTAGGQRAGIGPVLPARQARTSWHNACLALRLTAAGTPEDPGERVVLADEAGTLLAIADAADSRDVPPPDVTALESAAAHTPWMLETLEAISTTNSVRDAASLLHLHHSTVHERAVRAERILGWAVLTQRGKQRAQLALVMRRLHGSARSNRAAHDHHPGPDGRLPADTAPRNV